MALLLGDERHLSLHDLFFHFSRNQSGYFAAFSHLLTETSSIPKWSSNNAVPLIKYAGGSSMVWSVLNLPSPAACQALSMISSRLSRLMEKVTSPRGTALLPVSNQCSSSSVGDLRDTCCHLRWPRHLASAWPVTFQLLREAEIAEENIDKGNPARFFQQC